MKDKEWRMKNDRRRIKNEEYRIEEWKIKKLRMKDEGQSIPAPG